ncbi:MAG: hypothetical protein RBQ97_06460 [Acholeplasma sp.]|nr:hypothetical protein [Acholeplasma sp.]
MNKTQKWIEDTALFYFRIFSGNYGEDFLNKLLKGGGGNSTLCASWYQLSPVFVPQRISGAALTLLREKSFDIIEEGNKIRLKKSQIKENHVMFYNNAKGAEKRTIVGKYFHFDHNPSNKKILSLLNAKIKGFMESQVSEQDILLDLSEYLKTIQTVDLITVEQDEIRTNADRDDLPLTNAQRDDLINDTWYTLEIY